MDENKSRFSHLRIIVELIPFNLPWFQEMNDLTFQFSDFDGSNFILLQKRMIPKVWGRKISLFFLLLCLWRSTTELV